MTGPPFYFDRDLNTTLREDSPDVALPDLLDDEAQP